MGLRTCGNLLVSVNVRLIGPPLEAKVVLGCQRNSPCKTDAA